MLTLDRGVGGAFRPVDLNELLVEQTHLAHRAVQSYEAGFGAEISMELESGLEEIVAVPEDIARVIANVVTNACQSMAERGRLEEEGYKAEMVVGTASMEDGVAIVVTGQRDGDDAGSHCEDVQPVLHDEGYGKEHGAWAELGL